MFTQCPQCGSYFRIRSEHLDAAGGQVRCSLCTTTFDALERLHTRVPGQDEEAPAPSEGPETDGAAQDPAAVGDLFEDPPPPKDGPEAVAPENDARAAQIPHEPQTGAGAANTAEAATTETAVDDAADTETLAATEVPPAAASQPAPESSIPDSSIPELDDWAWTEPPASRGRRWPWLLGCLSLLLILAGQMLHFEREHWMQQDGIGPWLEHIYTELGQPPQEPRDLDQVTVLRSNVTAIPGRPGELQVTGLVANTADFEQPVPVVFLRLQDRWGDSVGSGFFAPEDWVSGRPAPERMEPGQRLAMRVKLADPERQAAGFQLELCWADDDGFRCPRALPP